MIILKIGGGAAINLTAIADDIARLNEPVIVVHGGNAARDELARQLGYSVTTVKSQSGYTSVLTDERAIDLLMMAYAGLRNKRIVELLQSRQVNAIGLTGIDGRLIQGQRNRGIRVQEGEKKKLLHDISGKPRELNTDLLALLIERGYTPVLSVPIADENGFAVNTDNDEIVALLQAKLGARCVVHLIEAKGLLSNHQDPESRIPELSASELGEWELRVNGRMKRKLHALKKLFSETSPVVFLGDGRVERPLTSVFAGLGTIIR